MWLRRRPRTHDDDSVHRFLSTTTTKVRSLIAPAVFLCAVALSVVDHAREESGVTMPEMVGVAGRELQLNGMGVFKEKAFFKVYVAGLYLEEPTADARAAINTEKAKRIVLVMLRDLSRENVCSSGRDRRPAQLQPDDANPARATRSFGAGSTRPQERECSRFHIPAGGRHPGARPRQRDDDIGQGFCWTRCFRPWLGTKPVNATLKRKLLGE
jgi:hypothetical protein